MKHSFTVLAAFLISLLSTGVATPLEFDQKAKKMGLEGIAWDGTFTVYATDDELAKETLAHIKQSYATILEQLNKRALRKKCLVFVWSDRYKFMLQATTFARSNISHMGAFVIRNMWKDYHALCAFKSDYLYDRILPHELAHLVLPIFLDPGKNVPIPLWLNEGFAQYQEKDSIKEAVCTIKVASKKNKLFKLYKLARIKRYPISHAKKQIYYDQSEVLVRFLIEKQNEPGDFFRFVQELSCTNKSFESALKACYPAWPDLVSLEQDFHNYIAKKVQEFPAESYRLAYLETQSAKRLQHENKEDEALREYAQALSDLVLISENFPDYNPKAIRKQMKDCWDNIADVAGIKESSDIKIGTPRKKVVASLGNPQKTDKGKLSYPGLDLKLDEGGSLSSIEMTAPCKEMISGIRIGDPLDRVELIYGEKSPKARATLVGFLVKELKLISLEKLKPGTYPIYSEGKFHGQVIKMDGEEELHFIRPIHGGRSMEKVTFKGDTVQKLQFLDKEEAKLVSKRSPSSQAINETRESGAKKRPNFNIGDHESKFIKYLGEPLDRGDKLIAETKRKGGRLKKQSFTDKFHMHYLLYEGLYVLLSAKSGLYIKASEPFEGTVNGIAIGNTSEKVQSLMGRPDSKKGSSPKKVRSLMGQPDFKKGFALWEYKKMGNQLKYEIYFKKGKVSRIKAHRLKYRGGTFDF